LKGPRVPSVLGFDPLYQFMHEQDAASAICQSLSNKLRGVFNVAGPQPVPLSLLIKVTGRTQIPVPEPLMGRVLGRFGFPALPKGSVNHLKYPIVIDDSEFRRRTDFAPAFDEIQTMEAFRWAA
ncbi:MAG: epimerase, partial [Persicimonas sp.]